MFDLSCSLLTLVLLLKIPSAPVVQVSQPALSIRFSGFRNFLIRTLLARLLGGTSSGWNTVSWNGKFWGPLQEPTRNLAFRYDILTGEEEEEEGSGDRRSISGAPREPVVLPGRDIGER